VKQFVIYTRVSTKSQGDSGLGLEAQERDIRLYLDNYAEEHHEIIGSFCDVESGTKADRLQLQEALELVRQNKATLLVSKLDRLSRKVSFIATLMDDKKIDFKVASMPTADKVMLHIYAVLSEAERDFISTRTKAALQEAKARGVKLGGNRPNNQARHDAVKVMADQMALKVYQLIRDNRKTGRSYRVIADQLNSLKVATAKGGKWYASTVRNYDKRLSVSGS
jgi:DNA invertase Pin-like site-specific DNA recombinase